VPDQRVLSDRVKTATKTALAVVLAYGVALSMDWEKPYWAAFTVAFCSLSTVGESLNKGLLRLSGTLLGGVAAITLLALFPQDRWLFLIGMSIFTGFCTSMIFRPSCFAARKRRWASRATVWSGFCSGRPAAARPSRMRSFGSWPLSA